MALDVRKTLNRQTKPPLLASPILSGLLAIFIVLSLSTATLGVLCAYAYFFPTDSSIIQLSGQIAKAGTMATSTAVVIGLSLPLGQFLNKSKPQSNAAIVIVALISATLAALAQWFNLTLLKKVITSIEVLSAGAAMLVATVGIVAIIIRKYRRSRACP